MFCQFGALALEIAAPSAA